MPRRPAHAQRDALLDHLRTFQWDLLLPALREAIRLLEHERFDQLTGDQIDAVANYRAIELEDELFFERAFTPGKEAAASLAYARIVGRDVVLGDLRRLHDTLGLGDGRGPAL